MQQSTVPGGIICVQAGLAEAGVALLLGTKPCAKGQPSHFVYFLHQFSLNSFSKRSSLWPELTQLAARKGFCGRAHRSR